MTIYHHQFDGHFPRVKWTLVRTDPKAEEVIAEGVALTKGRAWDASIAALPPLLTDRAAIKELLASTIVAPPKPHDAELVEARQRLRYADAVARVWIDGLMSEDSLLRTCAHPLACVRGALAGETDAVELGCEPEKLRRALWS